MTPSTAFHIKKQQSEFLQILSKKNIYSVYQPIVSLSDATIFGYEALTRGPKNSHFYSPMNLFPFAEAADKLFPTEKMARESAIENSTSFLKKQEKLFLNFSPKIIHDPSFSPGVTASLLKKFSLTPENVVFEITERHAIDDYHTFRTALNHYRDQGFKIAIDDAGAGYSSAQAISELSPDFIKIDRSLVSGIHQSEVKEKIFESFISIAKKCNGQVIAEGIETNEELCKVIELGADFGQGYIFARPNHQPLPLEKSAECCVRNCRKGVPISSILSPIQTFDRSCNPKEITRTFQKYPSIEQIIITQNKQPLHLLKRESWLQHDSLNDTEKLNNFFENMFPIDTLTVDYQDDIDTVIQQVLHQKPNGDLVVAKDDEIIGFLSKIDLLEYLFRKAT